MASNQNMVTNMRIKGRLSLKTLRLNTSNPCCKQHSHFVRLVDVPVQRYARKCSKCGQKWDVVITLLADASGLRTDKIDWTPEK